MFKFKCYLWAAAGLLMLVGVLSLISPKRALAAIGYTPVRDVDQPARQAVQLSGGAFSFGGGTGSSALVYTVPSGKRLVIETVGCLIELPPGQTGSMSILLTLNGQQTIYFLPATLIGNNGWAATQSVRLYADSGTIVELTINRSSNSGDGSGSASFSGYLVNMP
jgi:hypothetical protein